jgi:hypothetical protein
VETRIVRRALISTGILLFVGHSATAQPQASTVPSFIAWKVYCLSLGLATETADDSASATIRQQVGLSVSEASMFVVSARNYLRALGAIDRGAIAETLARYPAPARSIDTIEPAPGRSDKRLDPVAPRVRLPRNAQSVKAELIRSGYLAQVAARHRAAEASFTSELQRILSSPAYGRLNEWVLERVRPNIRVTEASGVVPAPGAMSRRQR